ncbi:hypothetical protein BJX70DRAFT_371346 [Aspergillus crustosus]
MEALSPRSTNQMIKPKPSMERKLLDKNAAAANAAQKASTVKNHAPPPPALVLEPEDDGESYSTGAFLGKGGFAICYEGTLLRNGRVFAMKVVKSEMTQKKMQEKFRTELQIHSKMRHPHIVGFHRAFAFDQCIYVILELCPNGSVMDMVRKRKCLSLPEVRRFMVQLCGAVKYLHKRNVAHRDLKMGNLFLDRNMDIKVGDFGLAAMIISEKDEKRRKTLCGTPNYIAPEVLDRSKGGHTQKVDIWSLGVICFAMLTGYPPFQSKTQEEIYKKVRNLTYVWPKDSECPNHIPEEAKSLVTCCLNLDEQERPEPDDIVEHAFFNMYHGCIPKRLDPVCNIQKPSWLRSTQPLGDSMAFGHGIDYDEKFASYIMDVDDPILRYRTCKAAFYSSCGVGRKPDGMARKSVGHNSSKSAFAECLAEEEKGLQPLIPLPEDIVYKYPHNIIGDWSVLESLATRRNDSALDSSLLSSKSSTTSLRVIAVSQSRTQVALAAAQQRRNESQSHAAGLRQQALTGRNTVRKVPSLCDPLAPAIKALPDVRDIALKSASVAPVSTGGLADRPIRTRRGAAASYSGTGSIRGMDASTSTAPGMLKVGKTRSQSPLEDLPSRSRQPSVRSVYKDSREVAVKKPEPEVARNEEPPPRSRPQSYPQPLTRSGSKASVSSGAKSRSSLGLHALLHSDDHYELLPGSSVDDVNIELRNMLANLVPNSTARRRLTSRRPPHAYVIKWVDYTNRYGIGYVLDDGSVGCVFKAENGQPASGVVMRDGEKHIRRKAHSQEKSDSDSRPYSEADQLVPRNGRAVEFYENCSDEIVECRGGIRKALILPTLFEVKGSSGGVRVRTDSGVDRARADAEKIKRVKLVDQFGKYMIGSLGRHGEEGMLDDPMSDGVSGQFIKFYQRLGNVGIWGFGDGAFQFNFPDHTKLVLAPGRTRNSSPWMDFYHLSPSAARYLSTKGKMHPSGFDTRAVVSDEVATFLSIAYGTSASSLDDQIREVLDANSFLQKITFIKDVLKRWIRRGRLGGRSSSDRAASEMFWEGAQERAHASGGGSSKFVWVTVGAPGGDGEYRSVSLRDKKSSSAGVIDQEIEALKERLQLAGL